MKDGDMPRSNLSASDARHLCQLSLLGHPALRHSAEPLTHLAQRPAHRGVLVPLLDALHEVDVVLPGGGLARLPPGGLSLGVGEHRPQSRMVRRLGACGFSNMLPGEGDPPRNLCSVGRGVCIFEHLQI